MFRMGPRGLEPCQSLLPRAFAGQGLGRAQYPDRLQRCRENVFGGIPQTTGYWAVSRRISFTDSGRRHANGGRREVSPRSDDDTQRRRHEAEHEEQGVPLRHERGEAHMTPVYLTNLSLAVAVIGPGTGEGGAGAYVQS